MHKGFASCSKYSACEKTRLNGGEPIKHHNSSHQTWVCPKFGNGVTQKTWDNNYYLLM